MKIISHSLSRGDYPAEQWELIVKSIFKRNSNTAPAAKIMWNGQLTTGTKITDRPRHQWLPKDWKI